jgi:hypothetical protein
MPIPDYQSLMLPVLRFAGDRKEHSLAEFRQRLAARVQPVRTGVGGTSSQRLADPLCQPYCLGGAMPLNEFDED